MTEFQSELSQSEEYGAFRSSVPFKSIRVAYSTPSNSTSSSASSSDKENEVVWKVFDSGPREMSGGGGSAIPLICLPPVSGTADVYYLQMLNMSARSVRVISASPPPFNGINEFCLGFKALLDELNLEKVHLLGAALGGFLAQKFAEFTRPCPRVASLILCNTFTDTSVFQFSEQAHVFWLMPGSLMKSMILNGMGQNSKKDPHIQRAINFMVERLDTLEQKDLSSRLAINCTPSYVQPHLVNDIPVTIIDSWDESALSSSVKEDLYKSYPNAKMGYLKSGGNFPFLSRPDEFNLYIVIHLRNFDKGNQ